MTSYQIDQIRNASVWVVVIAILHFVVGTQSHALHGIHIILAGLSMAPILMVSMAFERRGGVITAMVVSIVYTVHLLVIWSQSPMANLDQYAWLLVYPTVGYISGNLVHTANMRRMQRDQVIQESQLSDTINGITGFLVSLGVRDQPTMEHSKEVAAMAVKIGKELGLRQEVLSDLNLAALVHDIGKTGIPDSILFHKGRLDEEQMASMRTHVELAVSMLNAIPHTDSIARIVAQHHECPDGSGYPNGLMLESIDPAASILHVADIYTALTENRPYHEAMTSMQALEVMSNQVGVKVETVALTALDAIVNQSMESDS